MPVAPAVIDLSRLPAPNAIETLNYEVMLRGFKERFLAFWAQARAENPLLPAYDVELLETDPAIIVGEAWSYLRLLDRTRVNDAYKALLAPFASGSDLDAIAGARNIQRKAIPPATASSPTINEGDEALFRRYLLSYDKASAGSAGRYEYEAWTSWPQSEDKGQGLWDVRVNGFKVHGRRGDTDVVISGPFGRDPTAEELARVREAVTRYDGKPEAVSVAVFAAKRVEYQKSFVLEVPGIGSAPEIIRTEAEKRIRAASIARSLIGGQVPPDLLAGAAYGENVITVRDLTPLAIEPDPYTVPVLVGLTLEIETRS